MSIAFDDAAAESLIRVCETTAGSLRTQSGTRRASVEQALQSFSGGYALAFEAGCVAEALDRGRLAGALEDLVPQVQSAQSAARRERARLAAAAAWREREFQRQQSRLFTLAAGGPSGLIEFSDPEPTSLPITAPSVGASFQATSRSRTAAGGTGMTSADPDRLREFAQISGTDDGVLSADLTALRNAWSGFTGSCSWARIGSASFLTGFQDLIHENQVESAWIRSIAEAFEQAGAGSLADAELRLNWMILEDPAAAQQSMAGFTSAEKEAFTLWGWFLEQISIPKDDPMGLLTWTTGHTLTAADRGTMAASRLYYGEFRLAGRHAHMPSARWHRWTQYMQTTRNWGPKPASAAGFRGLDTVSKRLGVAGALFTGTLSGIEQWEADADLATEKRIATTAAKGGAVGMGALGVAYAGAQAGAFVGALGGPVGAIVGGVVGGAVGGIIGSGLGEAVGNFFVDLIKDPEKTGAAVVDTLTFWD